MDRIGIGIPGSWNRPFLCLDFTALSLPDAGLLPPDRQKDDIGAGRTGLGTA
jgi:hypothetical protein